MNEIRKLISDNRILSKRGPKNPVSAHTPYARMIEKERTAGGEIEDVAIIFLTNRECPFHCLMCDLWKNTLDSASVPGSIPLQIEKALENLPSAKHLKLYNSGSFFDVNAIPEADYSRIASLVSSFETVIVESHPKLINQRCLDFRKMLKPELQVAMGLETVNPGILKSLNKKMTSCDFASSAGFLKNNGIPLRAFILLKPPFMSEDEGIYWAERSVEFAFGSGAGCCTIIPVRAGNGIMDELMSEGYFTPPRITSLEKVLEYGISLGKGRVFADTWDLKLFSTCEKCFNERVSRITGMNLLQKILPDIICACGIE